MKRTNVILDEALLEEALRRSGEKTYSATINRALQERVHKLFYASQAIFGYMGLGSKESLRFSPYESCYEAVDSNEQLYRRIR